MIPLNTRIRTVQRIGSTDQYNRPNYETVANDVGAFFVRQDRLRRERDGDFTETHGMMTVYSHLDIQKGDLITLEAPKVEQYRVYSVTPAFDDNGIVQHLDLTLVRLVSRNVG